MKTHVVSTKPIAVIQGQSLRYPVVVSRLLDGAQDRVRIGKAYRVDLYGLVDIMLRTVDPCNRNFQPPDSY